MSRPSVLVLRGGPDAEHAVSLQSAATIEHALAESGHAVHAVTIDRPSLDELRALPGEVVWPALHGAFGEGGPLQDLLASMGRPYVGCASRAARLAMDKVAAKLAGARIGVPTKPACVFNRHDPACPLPMPVVLKPVHDGSSVGLHLCDNQPAWERARRAASEDISARPGRAYMIEPLIRGRELTVGVLERDEGLVSLPLIEIIPASGPYDYDAKYTRDDTRYVLDPRLPRGVGARVATWATELARALGVRHLCRVDFLLDELGNPWLLELNTMPGFTSHSLLPMAARHAGMEIGALCAHLVGRALRDARSSADEHAPTHR